MNDTPKKKITKEEIYLNEMQIQEKLGDIYNNTMSHRLKEKDTFKTINPTYGLWKNEIVYKTTTDTMKATGFKDPYHDETFFFKMDFNKRFTEEMLRAKNMMAKKTSVDKKVGKS